MSDSNRVQEIMEAHGVATEWGFPATEDELAELERRIDVQAAISEAVIETLQELEGYAGFYFDHQNEGWPTVLTTAADQHVVLEIIPPDLRAFTTVRRVDHSWVELTSAAQTIIDANGEGSILVHRIAVKTKENRLEVSIADVEAIVSVTNSLRSFVTVPFDIVIEPLSNPDDCTSRNNCDTPMRAGIRVDGGGSVSTLGYGILHGTDKQFVMAGHHSASSYSHPGYGTIGSTAENEFFNNGIDARAIFASDSQVSDLIYVTSSFMRHVVSARYPSVGLTVCLSGLSNTSCGSVQDDYVIYGVTGGITGLLGASANYFSEGGDSGGPVYAKCCGSGADAVGIHSSGTGDREFARVVDIHDRIGAIVLSS